MTEPAGPELSIVIVNHNAGACLDRCLTSLERRRGNVDAEVLVIDNGSSDGSQIVAQGRPGVRLVDNGENRFLSPAWNQGAEATSGRYLLFLNPDTEWWSGTVEDLVRIAREHPDVGILGPMIRNPDGTVYPSGRRFPSLIEAVVHAFVSPFTRRNPFTRRYEIGGWDRTTEREVDWVSGACMLIPRAAFDAVGGFDEGFPLYAEELDIATRLRREGWRVLFTPEVEVLHEIGASTPRARWVLRMHSDSVFRYYRKHRATGWRRITLPLAWLALRARAELAWWWRRRRG
jgi:N-acetylglucosaminyl-diphospho-decaprenol L-rhamnosyltransferase